MSELKLLIGDFSKSSWSLRPWLFLKHHGVPFEETVIALDQPDTLAKLLRHSPTGKVPLLIHGKIKLWESLAICEYAAETFALPRAWPLEPAQRALARALACEMLSGFAELRRELPFNPRRVPHERRLGDKAGTDLARLLDIFKDTREAYGRDVRHKDEGWLFGSFGIVDAMFAPTALRLHQYAVPVKGAGMDYVYAVLAHPAVQEWIEHAKAEPAHEPAPAAETAAEKTLERTREIPPSMFAPTNSPFGNALPDIPPASVSAPKPKPAAAPAVVPVPPLPTGAIKSTIMPED